MRLAQLEAIMKEKSITRQELADSMEVKYLYLTKRILGYIDIDVTDMRKIIKILNLTNEEIVRCFYLI